VTVFFKCDFSVTFALYKRRSLVAVSFYWRNIIHAVKLKQETRERVFNCIKILLFLTTAQFRIALRSRLMLRSPLVYAKYCTSLDDSQSNPCIIFTRPNSGHVYPCIQTTSD